MSKKKILTLNNISVAGLDRLPRDQYEVSSDLNHPDAVLLRSYNLHEWPVPASVHAIGRAGAGVNNIPVSKMTEVGIAVFNAPGANANAVKELVVAGMLMACRNLGPAWEFSRSREGDDASINSQVEEGKKNFVGFELPGKTLGVFGLGAIGVQVANAAIALGMRVIGYDPSITVKRAWQLSSQAEQALSVDDLLSRVDFVTFHVPLIDATRNMINRESLKIMKQGVVILNFARKGIVDDDAVCEALETGKVYGYVCDFPSNQLKNRRGVITLPHLGASTNEAEENCAVMVADQVRDYLENGNVSNSVNFPEVNLPRNGQYRMAIVNANVPNMVGQISTDLGKAGINILDMLNKSRGDLAYTLVDLDKEVSQKLVTEIERIHGVIRVRLL